MKRLVILASVVALSLSALPMTRAQTPARLTSEYRKTHETEITRELVELLSIPNVASDTANIRPN